MTFGAIGDVADGDFGKHPWMMWRRAAGYLVNVEGRWWDLASVAAHCRKSGYSGRGIMYEFALARVRTQLAAKDL
jgi:hypothetical protein